MNKIKKIANFVQNEISKCRVLVIGDVMLDKYYFGEVKRISPEAPVPITRIIDIKETLGGAANVSHNLALLGCETFLVGRVGNDVHRDSLIVKLEECGVHCEGLVTDDLPTTTKVRVMGGHQQMLRMDFEEVVLIEGELEAALCARIDKILLQSMQSVVISDYGKGVCTKAICQYVIKKCKEQSIPVIIDPKGNRWEKYSGADYITPNLKEINEVIAYPVSNEDETIKKAAQYLRRKYRIKNIMVTRSEKGLSLCTARKAINIPTLAQEVFDVSGAGDTVISVFSAAVGGKVNSEDAAYLANIGASVVVAKMGTYAVSQTELLQAIENKLRE